MNIYEAKDEDRCSKAYILAEDIKTAIELYNDKFGFYPFTIDTINTDDSIALIQEKNNDVDKTIEDIINTEINKDNSLKAKVKDFDILICWGKSSLYNGVIVYLGVEYNEDLDYDNIILLPETLRVNMSRQKDIDFSIKYWEDIKFTIDSKYVLK